ncbi:MAG TPA: hypothetical protein VH853_06385 [Polyangia bacterium]|jgi:hypothetical protein|nr:hypothetical protein [Polyangia bacterium]
MRPVHRLLFILFLFASGACSSSLPGAAKSDGDVCTAMSAVTCTAGCYVLSAQRIYSTCVGPSIPVGCTDYVCSALVTEATDSDGNLWRFSENCLLPPGWTSQPGSGSSSLPFCADGGATD